MDQACIVMKIIFLVLLSTYARTTPIKTAATDVTPKAAHPATLHHPTVPDLAWEQDLSALEATGRVHAAMMAANIKGYNRIVTQNAALLDLGRSGHEQGALSAKDSTIESTFDSTWEIVNAENCNISPVERALKTLQSGNPPLQILTTFQPNGPNWCFVWRQDGDRHAINPAGNTHCRTVYNSLQGVIVILDTHGPSGQFLAKDRVASEETAPIPLLSDASSIGSDKICELYLPPSGTKFDQITEPPGSLFRPRVIVFQSFRAGAKTMRIIQTLLNLYSPASQHVPPWPGLRFDLGTWQHSSLLGTRDFEAVVWFLAQRKRFFGVMTLGSVRLFSGDGEGMDALCIMWIIKNVDSMDP